MNFITIFAFLLFCNNSFAFDETQYNVSRNTSGNTNLIGIECNQISKYLEIGYFTQDYPPDRKMDVWVTPDIKIDPKNGKHLESVRELTKKCLLGNDQYIVRIRPVSGKGNLDGICGEQIYGGATILKNDTTIFDENFQECDSRIIIRKVIISPMQRKPFVIKEEYKYF